MSFAVFCQLHNLCFINLPGWSVCFNPYISLCSVLILWCVLFCRGASSCLSAATTNISLNTFSDRLTISLMNYFSFFSSQNYRMKYIVQSHCLFRRVEPNQIPSCCWSNPFHNLFSLTIWHNLMFVSSITISFLLKYSTKILQNINVLYSNHHVFVSFPRLNVAQAILPLVMLFFSCRGKARVLPVGSHVLCKTYLKCSSLCPHLDPYLVHM